MKFVDKNLALKLREKGFNKPCFGFYNPIQDELQLYCSNDRDVTYKNILTSVYKNKVIVDAPTIDQVLEWLREEKYINFGIFPYTYTAGVYYNLNLIWKINPDIKFEVEDFIVNIPYKTYEDACIAGIEYVIEHLI
jgi:hypothetical protein